MRHVQMLCCVLVVALLAGCATAPTAPTPAAAVSPPVAPATEAAAAPQSPTTEPAASATAAPSPTSGVALQTPTPTAGLPATTIDPSNVAQLTPLRSIGFGFPFSVALAPDGTRLAVATSAGVAWFALPDLTHLRFDQRPGGVTEVAFSPDGAVLAMVGPVFALEQQTELRRVADNMLLATLDGSVPQFSADGSLVATVIGADLPPAGRTTVVWRSSDGTQLAAMDGTAPRFSLDGSTVATTVGAGGLPNRTQLWQLDGTAGPDLTGTQLVFDADGSRAATVDGTLVQLWQLPEAELAATLDPGVVDGTPVVVAFAADDQRLVVAAGEELQTWDIASAELIDEFRHGGVPLTAEDLQLGPDGAVLASLEPVVGDCPPLGARLVDAQNGDLIYSDEQSYSVAFAADRTRAALLGERIVLVDLVDGTTAELEIAGYQDIAISPDGATLAASRPEVELWDIATNERQAVYQLPDERFAFAVSRMQFTPDGQQLTAQMSAGCAAIAEQSIVSWDATGDFRAVLEVPVDTGGPVPGPPQVRAFSPAGEWLAWVDPDGQAVLQAAGEAPQQLPVQANVTALAFSPDGSFLAVGDSAGAVTVINPVDSGVINIVNSAAAAVTVLAFSADSELLGVRHANGPLLVQPVTGGVPLVEFSTAPAPEDEAALNEPQLAFSADKQLLLLADNATLQIFGVGSGEEVYSLPAPVDGFALGPGQRLLATLSDGRIIWWGVN